MWNWLTFLQGYDIGEENKSQKSSHPAVTIIITCFVTHVNCFCRSKMRCHRVKNYSYTYNRWRGEGRWLKNTLKKIEIDVEKVSSFVSPSLVHFFTFISRNNICYTGEWGGGCSLYYRVRKWMIVEYEKIQIGGNIIYLSAQTKKGTDVNLRNRNRNRRYFVI